MTSRWLLIRDDGREWRFDDWRYAAAAHSVLKGSQLIEEKNMDRSEAVRLAERLLERAGPNTEILIKATALRTLISEAPPATVTEKPTDKLRDVIAWARGQADIWRLGERDKTDDTMVEKYDLLAAAAESTLPAPMWKVRGSKHGDAVFESWAFPTEIEIQQHAHFLITEGFRKVEIEAP